MSGISPQRPVIVAVITTLLIVTAGALAAGGAAAQSQDGISIELSDPGSSTTGSGDGESQGPAYTASQPISYNNGSNYEIVTTNVETGTQIITTPPVQTTTAQKVIVYNPTSEGLNTNRNFWIPREYTGALDAPVEATGPVTEHGIARLRVSLRDAQTGEIVARTSTKSYIIGFRPELSVTTSGDSATLLFRSDEIPTDSSIQADVYNNDADFPDDTVDKTAFRMQYDQARQAFVGTFDLDELRGGEYEVRLQGNLPDRFGSTAFDKFEGPVIVPESGTDGSSGPVVEDNLQLSGSTVTIEHGGASAVGVSGIPDAYYPAEDIGTGALQQSDNGIIWQGPSGSSVTFTLTPPPTATAGDTVSFEVKVGGQDPQPVTLAVTDVSAPSDFPSEAAKFQAIAGEDGSIDTFDLIDAIEGASENGRYNGVEIGTFDFVDIIDWNSGS